MAWRDEWTREKEGKGSQRLMFGDPPPPPPERIRTFLPRQSYPRTWTDAADTPDTLAAAVMKGEKTVARMDESPPVTLEPLRLRSGWSAVRTVVTSTLVDELSDGGASTFTPIDAAEYELSGARLRRRLPRISTAGRES